jgi:hypothetical protein
MGMRLLGRWTAKFESAVAYFVPKNPLGRAMADNARIIWGRVVFVNDRHVAAMNRPAAALKETTQFDRISGQVRSTRTFVIGMALALVGLAWRGKVGPFLGRTQSLHLHSSRRLAREPFSGLWFAKLMGTTQARPTCNMPQAMRRGEAAADDH